MPKRKTRRDPAQQQRVACQEVPGVVALRPSAVNDREATQKTAAWRSVFRHSARGRGLEFSEEPEMCRDSGHQRQLAEERHDAAEEGRAEESPRSWAPCRPGFFGVEPAAPSQSASRLLGLPSPCSTPAERPSRHVGALHRTHRRGARCNGSGAGRRALPAAFGHHGCARAPLGARGTRRSPISAPHTSPPGRAAHPGVGGQMRPFADWAWSASPEHFAMNGPCASGRGPSSTSRRSWRRSG
jgi:hypothetical protein